jgi:hypothetical protein
VIAQHRQPSSVAKTRALTPSSESLSTVEEAKQTTLPTSEDNETQ